MLTNRNAPVSSFFVKYHKRSSGSPEPGRAAAEPHPEPDYLMGKAVKSLQQRRDKPKFTFID